MPTGYTASVMDGKITDFNQFAMQCARAFGALILMRDDPWDAPVPEKFEPHDYNQKALLRAQERLKELQTMTPEQVEEASAKDFETATAEREKYKAGQRLENDRLNAMLAAVLEWTPPSANHSEMKSFMIEQISISKNDVGSIDKYMPIKNLTPKEWFNEQIEKAHKDVGYHAGEYAKEVERTEGRTLWVKQLRDSLKAPAVPNGERG